MYVHDDCTVTFTSHSCALRFQCNPLQLAELFRQFAHVKSAYILREMTGAAGAARGMDSRPIGLVEFFALEHAVYANQACHSQRITLDNQTLKVGFLRDTFLPMYYQMCALQQQQQQQQVSVLIGLFIYCM